MRRPTPASPPPLADPEARPLRRDAERNRLRILEAAAEMFSEHGLGVTMDDIAARAGVGVGTVYRRFPDKELLIDALFERRIAQIVDLARQSLLLEPWEGMVHFLRESAALQSTNRGLVELMLGTGHGHDRVGRARAQIAPLVKQIVARAHATGLLRPGVEATDLLLVSLMLSSVVEYTRDVRADVWARQLGLILDGLRSREEPVDPLPSDALSDDEVGEAMQHWRSRR